MDDDFALDFGEFNTIREMRDKVREGLVNNSENQADAKLREELVGQILRDYDFEVPSVMVERQAHERLNEFANMLIRSGMPPQSVKEMDWEIAANPSITEPVLLQIILGWNR